MENETLSFEELLNNSMKSNKLDKIVTGTVVYVNTKGEIYLDINYKADGIIPVGEYCFEEINVLENVRIGDKITAAVIKMNDGNGNVLLSSKRLKKQAEKKKKQEKEEKFWNETNNGDKFKGKVSSISSYGAFIDIDGIQGLLHISELTWDREKTANDILKVGEEIPVFILEIDRENKRIKLGYEKKGKSPWELFDKKVGDIVNVKIKSFTTFGAFAEITKGVEGLIHISQITNKRISSPEEVLKIGKKIDAKIIGMDLESKKIELSIREIENSWISENGED